MANKKLRSVLGSVANHMIESSTDTTENQGSQPGSSRTSESRFSAASVMDAMAGNMETMTTYEVDPSRCRLWAYHNRLYKLLDEKSCANLIESIRTHGQREPAKVRRIKGDGKHEFEVIAGARRLWVAHYLKARYKIEVVDVNDEEAFVLSDDSNKQEDVSSFERAIEYKRVLQDIYEGNQTRMAARINMSEANLSRYLALASLPSDIIGCVSDPRGWTMAHAEKLRAAMKGTELTRRIVERARELQQRLQGGGAPLTVNDAVKELLVTSQRSIKRNPKQEVIKGASGKPLFTVKHGQNVITLVVPMDVAKSKSNEAAEAVKHYFKGLP